MMHWTHYLAVALDPEAAAEEAAYARLAVAEARRRAERAEERVRELRHPLEALPMDGEMHLRIRLVDHDGTTSQVGRVISTSTIRYAQPELAGRVLHDTICRAAYEVIEHMVGRR